MKLSRTVSYAVQAALLLAQSSSRDPVPCSRIASEGKMPERFLLQILRSMVNHGILQSTRGVDGGYSLDRTPDKVSLLEIIEAIDGPLTTSIPAREGLASETHARLESALESVTAVTRERLSSLKLSQLMNMAVEPPKSATSKLMDSPESTLGPHFNKDASPMSSPRSARENSH